MVPVKRRRDPISRPPTPCMPSAPGIVLCEIQQNSDITYRLWDYGRPREIHVEQAVPIADLGVHPGPSRPTPLAKAARSWCARSTS